MPTTIRNRATREFFERSDIWRSLGAYYGYVQVSRRPNKTVFTGTFVVDDLGELRHVDGHALVRAKQE
jgi:hypothetical protein